jgi:hypothetical protein
MNDVLQRVTPGNFPASSPDRHPELLRAMRANDWCMGAITRIGLRLLLPVFVRAVNLSVTGRGSLLFPNQQNHTRPMSNNSFLNALERMGCKGDLSGHGFRGGAMTSIREKLGYRHEVVDLQLAHVKKNKVDRA